MIAHQTQIFQIDGLPTADNSHLICTHIKDKCFKLIAHQYRIYINECVFKFHKCECAIRCVANKSTK